MSDREHINLPGHGEADFDVIGHSNCQDMPSEALLDILIAELRNTTNELESNANEMFTELSDDLTAAGSVSWLANTHRHLSTNPLNPWEQQIGPNEKLVSICHLQVCERKCRKHRRKQDLNVRYDDCMEFIEGFRYNGGKVRFQPFMDIGDRENSAVSPVPSTGLNEALKNDRRVSISRKLDSPADSADYIQFTEAEEMDIMQRANAFLDKVKPYAKYCLPPRQISEDSVAASVLDKLRDFEFNDGFVPPILSLHAAANAQPVHVVNHQSYLLFKESKFHVELPIGTQLLKPEEKLVELVARAIDESPDGLLQVQQVYNYIMLRYPYFAFMDKLSTSSWRSSIRHALYQKWFRKIAVCDEKIGNKGCFWAINRQSTPREWKLPSQLKCPERAEPKLTENGCSTYSTSFSDTNMAPATQLQDTVKLEYSGDTGQIPLNELTNQNIEKYLLPPKPMQPAMWQPRSVQYMFGRNLRRAAPYCFGARALQPSDYPFAGLHYPRRPYLPRMSLLPRQAQGLARMMARPYLLPSSGLSTAVAPPATTLPAATTSM